MAESVGAVEESNLVLSAPGGVCEYEREREERIQRNRELMAELGITQAAAKLQQVLNKPASKRPPSKPSRSVLSLEKKSTLPRIPGGGPKFEAYPFPDV